MTKKHFIALADAIRSLIRHDDGETVNFLAVVEAMSDFCEEQNPRFDRRRWIVYAMGGKP